MSFRNVVRQDFEHHETHEFQHLSHFNHTSSIRMSSIIAVNDQLKYFWHYIRILNCLKARSKYKKEIAGWIYQHGHFNEQLKGSDRRTHRASVRSARSCLVSAVRDAGVLEGSRGRGRRVALAESRSSRSRQVRRRA